MKKITTIILFACLIACNQSKDTIPDSVLPTISNIKTNVPVKQFVAPAIALDIDTNIAHQPQMYSAEDMAKAKAATYRFYQHVQLQGNQYVCDLKNGKQINISQNLFKYFKNSLNQINASILQLEKNGEKVETPQVDSQYLNGLIK